MPIKYFSLLLFLYNIFLSPLIHAEPASKDIPIGAVLGLTGDWALWGTRCQNALTLAQERVNATGGIKGSRIKLWIEDSPHTTATSALTAYHRLRRFHDVKQMIGFFEAEEVEAVKPLAEKDQVYIGTFISLMKEKPKNSFFLWMDPVLEGNQIGERAAKKFRRAAILSSQIGWEELVSKGFEEAFRKAGGEIVNAEYPLVTTTNIQPEVLRTKSKNPDVLFIPSYHLLPLYLLEVKKLAPSIPIMSAELDQSMLDQCGTRAEGILFIRPSDPTHEFQETYKKRFGESPDLPAPQCFDAFNLLMEGMIHGGVETPDIAAYISSLSSFDGASGKVRFIEGKTSVDMKWMTVKGGKMVEEGE